MGNCIVQSIRTHVGSLHRSLEGSFHHGGGRPERTKRGKQETLTLEHNKGEENLASAR